jgi:hypothetical protein
LAELQVSPSIPTQAEAQDCWPDEASEGRFGLGTVNSPVTEVDFCIQGGEVSYDAWYEWYPDYAHDFSGIDISTGVPTQAEAQDCWPDEASEGRFGLGTVNSPVTEVYPAILQTGIDFCIQGGEVSYDAWYEWYPDYAHDFSGHSALVSQRSPSSTPLNL